MCYTDQFTAETKVAYTTTVYVYTIHNTRHDDDNIQGAVKLGGLSLWCECVYNIYTQTYVYTLGGRGWQKKNVIKTEWKNKCNGFRFMWKHDGWYKTDCFCCLMLVDDVIVVVVVCYYWCMLNIFCFCREEGMGSTYTYTHILRKYILSNLHHNLTLFYLHRDFQLFVCIHTTHTHTRYICENYVEDVKCE